MPPSSLQPHVVNGSSHGRIRPFSDAVRQQPYAVSRRQHAESRLHERALGHGLTGPIFQLRLRTLHEVRLP
jgi:hypothetical protein